MAAAPAFSWTACQKDGWQVEGFEPNETARKQAEETLQKKVETINLERFEKESFDIITLWHVLEHIHTLNETFQKLLTLLKPDGYYAGSRSECRFIGCAEI